MKRFIWLALASVFAASACGNAERDTQSDTGGSAGAGGGLGGATAGSSNGGKGGTSSPGGSAGFAGGTSGTGGSAGTIGAGGTNAGGTGGAAPDCPAAAPQDGSPCTAGLSCVYEDCSGAGRSRAQCASTSWSVQTETCATFQCAGSEMCMPGQICSITQGGTYFGTCIDNPCGTSAVSCDCVSPGCAACTVMAYPFTGITVTCNTCPQGNCP